MITDRISFGEDPDLGYVVLVDGKPVAYFRLMDEARSFARGYVEGFQACQTQAAASIEALHDC